MSRAGGALRRAQRLRPPRLAEAPIVLLRGQSRMGLAAVLGAALGLGLLGGFFFAASPLLVAGGLLGALAVAAVVADPRLGLWGAVLVIALLPFGVLPLPLGAVQPTFLEVALGAALVLWFLRVVLAPGGRLHVTPPGALVLVFLAITAIAFVNGTAYGFSAALARQYLKSVVSVMVFFTALNCLRDVTDSRRAVVLLIVSGVLAAALGIAIYLLPRDTALAVLNGLGRLGYPTGPDLLRFHVESERLRAVGTSIDPNAFGALLMVVLVVLVGQISAAAPVLGRHWLVAALLVAGAGLLLSLSRSSWVGCAGGVGFLALVRYRRFWPVFIIGVALALVGYALGADRYVERLPLIGQYFGHLLVGLRVEDQATAMRLGEYKDALTLISRYPWLGVGYGSAPDIDLYVGVSSLYLLLAENAGLIGLGTYLLAVGAVFWYALPVAAAGRDERLVGIASSCLAALFAALVAGLFDHPFINIRFPHLVALFWLLAGVAVHSARLAGSDVEAGGGEEAG